MFGQALNLSPAEVSGLKALAGFEDDDASPDGSGESVRRCRECAAQRIRSPSPGTEYSAGCTPSWAVSSASSSRCCCFPDFS